MPRCAVVGAGAFGVWTALHLVESGADVVLIDAWGPGNARSSSGGEGRAIRAVYGPDRIYVEMVRRSFELWGDLERETGAHLYEETGALWMLPGDEAYVRSSLPILDELGFPIEELTSGEAAARWPQVDFDGIGSVFVERRAGVLMARRGCRAAHRRFLALGGRYRTAAARPGAIGGDRLSELILDDGSTLAADAFVFACGPWLGRLFPEAVGDRVRPTRQEVYYFGTPAGSDAFGPARLPLWIDLDERIRYGFPDVHGRGFKIADDTRGETVDPSVLERVPTASGIADARGYVARRFPALAEAPLLEARVCQYENSPDGHFIVDRHPGAENLWLVGGGSGHGFKLSPAVGETVAGAVLGRGEVADTFGLERFSAGVGSATQFESGRGQGGEGDATAD